MFGVHAFTGLRRGDAAILGKQHIRKTIVMIDGQPVEQSIIMLDTEKNDTRVAHVARMRKLSISCRGNGEMSPFIVAPSFWKKPIISSLAKTSALRPPRPESAFARRSLPW
jgi:hypothetical protein